MENLVEIMGWGTRLVLVFLVLLSILSFAIMYDRRKAFRAIKGLATTDEAKKFIVAKDWTGLKAWAQYQKGIAGGMVLAALEPNSNNEVAIDRAVQSYIADERLKLERGLNVLATLGANAPFIGLFGTVLGIIQSFGILSNSQGSAMNAVMLGLAEALVSTAVGLFVAIPAVVAYNTFSQSMKTLFTNCYSLRDFLVSKKVGG